MFPFNGITIPFMQKKKNHKQIREPQHFKEVMYYVEIPTSDASRYWQNKNKNLLFPNTQFLQRTNINTNHLGVYVFIV